MQRSIEIGGKKPFEIISVSTDTKEDLGWITMTAAGHLKIVDDEVETKTPNDTLVSFKLSKQSLIRLRDFLNVQTL